MSVVAGAEKVGEGARILVVDDEPNITDLLSTALRYTGFSVAVASSGRQALAQATEFKLLRYLLLNVNRVLSKGQILDHVWQYDFGGDANVVETYISYLRKKIDRLGQPLIHTVRGVGYSLRLPVM